MEGNERFYITVKPGWRSAVRTEMWNEARRAALRSVQAAMAAYTCWLMFMLGEYGVALVVVIGLTALAAAGVWSYAKKAWTHMKGAAAMFVMSRYGLVPGRVGIAIDSVVDRAIARTGNPEIRAMVDELKQW